MSNLLEKASIITTPTAYSDGKLHSVKPVKALGDEVSNDVNFDNPSNWALTGQSTVSNGVAHILQDNSSNTGVTANTTIINKTYKITGVVSDYVSGSVGFASLGSTNPRVAIPSQNGEFTIYYTSTRDAPSTWNIQRIASPCNLKIDNVSVKEVIDADFDFQRGSAATRVNSQGLIENVQTLSGNLVQNGDFSEIGSEEVTNGDFATDSDWGLQTGWSITDSSLIGTNVGIYTKAYQNLSTKANTYYQVTIDVEELGTRISVFFQSTTGEQWQEITSVGIHTFQILSPISNSNFYIENSDNSSPNIKINNVSVKEVGQNWEFGTGWSIDQANSKAVHDSSAGATAMECTGLSVVVGKRYELKYTANNLSAGYIRAELGGLSPQFNFSSGTYTYNFVATTNANLYVTASADVEVTNVSVIEITDDTDLPRIDYTDGCGSLLLEPQSTNLITYSEDFSDSSWTLFGTIQANSSVSPNGLTTATKLTHTHSQYNMLRVIAFGVRTTSVFVKNLNADNFYIRGSDSGYAYYNFNTKTVNNNSLKVEYFANDWIRLSLTESNSLRQFGIGVDESDLSESGNSVYVWGAQLEEKSYPTSYIPTNGSTATRLADVCNNAGSSDLINSTEGVLYAEIKPISEGVSISLSDGTISNRVSFYYQNGIDIRGNIRIANSQVNISGGGNISDAYHKIALRWDDDTNILTFYKDGSLVGSVSYSGSLGANTLNNISFTQGDGTSSNFYGKNKAVAVFPYLTNDELEGLTGEGYDTFNALALANNYTII